MKLLMAAGGECVGDGDVQLYHDSITVTSPLLVLNTLSARYLAIRDASQSIGGGANVVTSLPVYAYLFSPSVSEDGANPLFFHS